VGSWLFVTISKGIHYLIILSACYSMLKVEYLKAWVHLYEMAVARIALVKPDKARGVEDVILRAAQTGQITEKVLQLFI
jgi:Double-stranded DNA-binding domain